jgi:hypothetical protein
LAREITRVRRKAARVEVGNFPGNFVDFVFFERTGFVLRFGDFVVAERADFCPQKILNLKSLQNKNFVSHVHG